MASFRGMAVVAAAGALATFGSGCVSADVHEKTLRQLEAHKAAYVAADTVVANERKEKDLLKLKIAALEKDIAAAKERIQSSDTVLAAQVKSIKDKYEEMLKGLRDDQGGEWTINRSTGGVVLEDGVYFAPGKAELKAEKFSALDALIAKLESGDLASAAIEIAGHTDQDPIAKSGWKDNFQLSAERARAVLVYFQKKGVPAERLFLSGYGPTRPRSEKKAENRRVEIVLHERT